MAGATRNTHFGGDLGQIIGEGQIKTNVVQSTDPDDPEVNAAPSVHAGLVWWDDSDAVPVPVENSSTYASTVWSADLEAFYGKLFPADCLVDAQGHFVALEHNKITRAVNTTLWTHSSAGFTSTSVAGLTDAGFIPAFTFAPNNIWGPYNEKVRLLSSGSHDFSGRVLRIASVPQSETTSYLAAFGVSGRPQVNLGGWQDSRSIAQGQDISDNKVAIFSSGSLWQDDYAGDFIQWAPELPTDWSAPRLIDAAPSGWILSSGDAGAKAAVAMPLSIEDDAKNTGVDSFSLTSPTGCDRRANWQAWVMVPANGAAVGFKIKCPASNLTPVKLKLPTGSSFSGGGQETQLTSSATDLTIQSSNVADAGTEKNLTLSLGDASSVSSPIGLKFMKARAIKVTVCIVPSVIHAADNTTSNLSPAVVPTAASVQDYLNNIFPKQLNATFSVNLVTLPSAVDWDQAPFNQRLDTAGNDSESDEQKAISSALVSYSAANPSPTPNITVFIVGGNKLISGIANGQTVRDSRTCWVRGFSGLGWGASTQLDVIAHEIGHVLVGLGHPDEGDGPAVLEGSDDNQRLMASRSHAVRTGATLLVKGEWDAAEDWFESEVRANRLDP